MTTDTDIWIWSEQRSRASKLFDNHALRDKDEETILRLFNTKPWQIREIIDTVLEEIERGSDIKWPWAIVASRCQRHTADTVVTGASHRSKRVNAAANWIENAGLYFDRESDLIDELFGDLGRLKAYTHATFHDDDLGHPTNLYTIDKGGDIELVEEMLAKWRQERPRGERAEAASLAYQERQRLSIIAREELKARKAAESAEPIPS